MTPDPNHIKTFMECLGIQRSRELPKSPLNDFFRHVNATVEAVNGPGAVRVVVSFPDGHQLRLGRRHGTAARKRWFKDMGDPFFNLETHSKIERGVEGWAVDPQDIDGYIFSWDPEISTREYIFWTHEILEAMREFWPMLRKTDRDTTQWTPGSHHSRSLLVSVNEMHEMLETMSGQPTV